MIKLASRLNHLPDPLTLYAGALRDASDGFFHPQAPVAPQDAGHDNRAASLAQPIIMDVSAPAMPQVPCSDCAELIQSLESGDLRATLQARGYSEIEIHELAQMGQSLLDMLTAVNGASNAASRW